MPDKIRPTDPAPLGWRDIEALPYYLAGAFGLFGASRLIAEAAPALHRAWALVAG